MKLLEETEHHRLRLEAAGLPYHPLARAESHHIVLDGMRFHYVDWGERTGRPIVLLHGGGQTCRTWDIVCHELAQVGFRGIALDLRGHGDSEWSYESDYRIESHASDVAALIEGLDLRRVVIVGMSLGGITGLHYALGNPDRVAAFVAVDIGPWVHAEGGAPIRQFMQEVASLDELEQFVDAAVRFNPRRDPRLLRRSLRNNLRTCPDGRLMWKTDLRRFGARTGGATDALAGLQRGIGDLRCPTLIVRGADSPILHEEHARRFAEAIPNGRWIAVEGAGHNVQGDQPAALVRALRDFLDATRL